MMPASDSRTRFSSLLCNALCVTLAKCLDVRINTLDFEVPSCYCNGNHLEYTVKVQVTQRDWKWSVFHLYIAGASPSQLAEATPPGFQTVSGWVSVQFLEDRGPYGNTQQLSRYSVPLLAASTERLSTRETLHPQPVPSPGQGYGWRKLQSHLPSDDSSGGGEGCQPSTEFTFKRKRQCSPSLL